VEILIESDRDRRTYGWLLAQVGEVALRDACLSLAGNRRLYVSNLAKALGLKPPVDLVFTPREEALRHLAEMREMLKAKSD
jgi:hypothetical protein